MSEFPLPHIHIEINGLHSPTTWMSLVTERVPKDLGNVFLRMLVGAVLEKRFEKICVVSNPPTCFFSSTTETDFLIGQIAYRLVMSPSAEALSRCMEDIGINRPSLLLVPDRQIDYARAIACELGAAEYITIISIENFVAMKINEFAIEQNKKRIAVFLDLVESCKQKLLVGANGYHLKLVFSEIG